MEKGKKFNLMAVILMAILVVVFTGCEKLTDMRAMSEETVNPEPAPEPTPEEPKFDFEYIVVNNGDEVEIEWSVSETVYNLSEKGSSKVSCSHENDKYAGPVSVSVVYSQERTRHGDVKTSTKASDSDRKVLEDAAHTSADVEDGNIVYADRKMERIVRTINDKEYELPYIEIGQPYLEAINQLPGTTKYGTRGDKVITDSVCRGFVWKADCTVKNYNNEKFSVTIGDTIRVYQMSENNIVSGTIKSTNRVVIDAVTERCDVVVEWTMLDGSTHEQTFSKILNRRIDTIAEYEKVVTEFGFNWLSDQPLSVGQSSVISDDGTWTVSGRTDTFTGLLSNNVSPINTSYGLYHEKAEFANTKFDLKHTFDYENWNPRERNTYEEDINSPRSGYTAKRLHNAISTSYLGYAQDASETVVLLKENAHITTEGWDKSKCKETISDDEVVWKLVYKIQYSDGKLEEFTFTFKAPRSLECETNWTSLEENKTHKTGGVTVKLVSSENKSSEKEGCKVTWVREYRKLTSTTTLDASTQENIWVAYDPNSPVFEYRGKTFSFDAHIPGATNNGKIGNGVQTEKNGKSVTQYKHTAKLEYTWGDNVKTCNAPGLIEVTENTFFPPEWGELVEALQTVTNTSDHEDFLYAWSLHFKKGVLPVLVFSGSTDPSFDFDLFEYTDDFSYNSATYVGGTWINTVASDQPSMMTWSRGTVEKANKDYNEAKSQNWDEGRLVNRHASVTTSRYLLQVKDGWLSATDTYTGTYMGQWK